MNIYNTTAKACNYNKKYVTQYIINIKTTDTKKIELYKILNALILLKQNENANALLGLSLLQSLFTLPAVEVLLPHPSPA